MKKTLALLFIAAFLFPALGHAAIAPAKAAAQTPAVQTIDVNSPALQGKTPAAKKDAVYAALKDIYSQLATLSTKAQNAANQLDANGIDTSDAQVQLTAANTILAKAKSDIAAFNSIVISTKNPAYSIDTMKLTANTAENTLHDAKNRLVSGLTALKAALPALDTDN